MKYFLILKQKDLEMHQIYNIKYQKEWLKFKKIILEYLYGKAQAANYYFIQDCLNINGAISASIKKNSGHLVQNVHKVKSNYVH